MSVFTLQIKGLQGFSSLVNRGEVMSARPWVAEEILWDTVAKSMKLGVVHEMILCKGQCDRAFWEHDNKAGRPSGNTRCVPVTVGNSDCVCQCLQIILHPSLATIFSSSPILLLYNPSFHFYPKAWRVFFPPSQHIITSPLLRRANRVQRDEWKQMRPVVCWEKNIMLFDLFNY